MLCTYIIVNRITCYIDDWRAFVYHVIPVYMSMHTSRMTAGINNNIITYNTIIILYLHTHDI